MTFQEIFGHDVQSALLIILNLVLIESLLSVDNAAVLATMVRDLPKEQRSRALKYGIVGAYVFRGICLALAAWIMTIWWLKPIGGLYLLFLAVQFMVKRMKKPNEHAVEEGTIVKERSKLYRMTIGWMGPFWSTVALIEIMDLAFSIDNVFAAVAFTDNIWLVCIGVFIGILAMRFVAQGFVKLMEKFPFLEVAAFLVIGILGVKLCLSLYTHFFPCSGFSKFMEGESMCLESQGIVIPPGHHEMVWGDTVTSLLTVSIFFVPVAVSLMARALNKKNT